MSFGPGGANASSAAQPAADAWIDVQSADSSATQRVEPAAQPVQALYSGCRLDVRWQVEHSLGQWWDIPLAAVISLPRLCLEGSYFLCLKGPGSGNRPGRFLQTPLRGSPWVSLA